MDVSELRKALNEAKNEQKPLGCAVAFSKDKKMGHLQVHRTHLGREVATALKKDVPNLADQIRFGSAIVTKEEPKLVRLVLNQPLTGIAKKLVKTLQGSGYNKVKIGLEDGTEIEGADGEADEVDPEKKARNGLANGSGDETTETQSEAGGTTPQETTPSLRESWASESEKIGPEVLAALQKGTGDPDKIRAVWAFAQGKAQAEDFEAALKSLVPLRGLLSAAATATKTPAEEKIKAGTVDKRAGELKTAADIVNAVAAMGGKLKDAIALLPARQVEIQFLIGEVQSGAHTNDPDRARVAWSKLDQILVEAGLKAAEKQKWEEAQAKMRPLLEAALKSGKGEPAKMRAVWDFAFAKSEKLDFTSALAALDRLPDMFEAANTATKTEATLGTTAGTVDKARYEGEVKALGPTLAQALKIGGFNDSLSALALSLRQLRTAVELEVAKPDYAAALVAHKLFAAKTAEIIAAKQKYDADKLIWEGKLAAAGPTITTVEGCKAISTTVDALKLPFDAAMLRARQAATARHFDTAARELDEALTKAKLFLDAKASVDETNSKAFAKSRGEGADRLGAIPPLAGAGGDVAGGVATAMENDKDLGKSKGLQTLLDEARLISQLYEESLNQATRGAPETGQAVIAAAERAIGNCRAFQLEHKASSKSKSDQAKFAQAEALAVRYGEMITGLRGLSQTFGGIGAGLAGSIKEKGRALGLLQAMTAPPAPDALHEGARARLREATAELMRTATCPDETRRLADLIGGEFKLSYDRQVAQGSLAQTAKSSTKAKAHGSTKVLDARRAENVDQSRLLADRLIGPDGRLEAAGLYACAPEGLAGEAPAGRHMARTLKSLREDPEVWAAIESIPAPQPGSTGDKMVRATLGLGPDAKVGPAEVRKAALSALLTDLRQKDVGSCFATQVAIRVHDSQPLDFLNDMAALMQTGALERTLHGEKVSVPLEGVMSDAALETSTITLGRGPVPQIKGASRGGELAKPASLQESPAFIAVFDQLGITDGREAAINKAVTGMIDSDEFKINQNRKALTAAAAKITNKDQRAAVLAAALPQVTADPASVRLALTSAMAAQTVPGGEQTLAGTAYDGKLSALEYDVEPGLLVRQLVMDKVGLDEDDFKNVAEFRARTEEIKTDPRMSRIDQDGRLMPLQSPADDDLKQKLSEVETLDKKIDWQKMASYEKSKQGSYDAFLGDEDNRLLRAWEYTVTALAEAGEMKASTIAIHAATKEAMEEELDDVFNTMSATTDFKKAKVKKADFNDYANQLLDEYEKQYDAVVRNGYDASVESETASDGSSSRGAHYLYDTRDASGPEQWIKIDDKAKYQVLVRGLVMLAWAELFAKEKDKNKREITRKLADQMADKMGTDGFIAQAKQKVATATGSPADSPWERIDGSWSNDVMQLYDERDAATTDLGTPADAEGLLGSITTSLRAMWNQPNSKLKTATNENPDVAGINTTNAGVHAFKMQASDPRMKAILESGSAPDVAVAQFKAAELQKWQDAAASTPADDAGDPRAFCERIWGKSVSDDTVNRVTAAMGVRAGGGVPNHDHLAKAAKEILIADGNDAAATDGWVGSAILAAVVPPVPAANLDTSLAKLAKQFAVPDDLAPAVMQRAKATLAGTDPANSKAIRQAMQSAVTEEGLDTQIDTNGVLNALRERPGLKFADSNWGDPEHHISYAMVVNPTSGEMEMWRMNEDGSNASKMDQDEWVKTGWSILT